MFKKTLFILPFLLFALPGRTQENAIASLDKAIAKISEAESISINFTLCQEGDDTAGTIDMQREKFVLHLSDMTVWFDGTTQWTYIESAQEVNISTPEAEELEQTSPLRLLQSYKKDFICQSTEKNGDICTAVLRPKEPANIQTVTITWDAKKNEITRLSVSQEGGASIEITLQSYKTDKNFSPDHFVFDKNKYPNTEIIDLR